jgi:hypothetical protein
MRIAPVSPLAPLSPLGPVSHANGQPDGAGGPRAGAETPR